MSHDHRLQKIVLYFVENEQNIHGIIFIFILTKIDSIFSSINQDNIFFIISEVSVRIQLSRLRATTGSSPITLIKCQQV